jgi:hypothetical protein
MVPHAAVGAGGPSGAARHAVRLAPAERPAGGAVDHPVAGTICVGVAHGATPEIDAPDAVFSMVNR